LEVAVRRLSREDLEGERLEELRRLWAELTSEYGGDELEYDGAAEEAWRRAMLASLGSDEARVLVAESREDGSILGYVFFVIRRPPLRSRYDLHVYVSDLVVRRDVRRRGIASALLRGLLDSLGGGVHRVYLRVPASNAPAIRFYERSGFRVSEYVMDMSVGDPRGAEQGY